MRRASFPFLFWMCLSVVLGVMGWLSVSLWRLENRRMEELSRNRMEELTRLALWRMDSVLALYWVKENGRAPQEYFFLTERDSEKRSPLFSQIPEYVRLYFQIDSEGGISSPQIPEGRAAAKGKDCPEASRKDFRFLSQSGIAALLRQEGRESAPVAVMPEAASSDQVLEAERKAESVPFYGDQLSVARASSPLPAAGEKREKSVNGKMTLKEPSSLTSGTAGRIESPVRKREASFELTQQKQSAIDYDIRLNFNKTLNSDGEDRQAVQSVNSPFLSKSSIEKKRAGNGMDMVRRSSKSPVAAKKKQSVSPVGGGVNALAPADQEKAKASCGMLLAESSIEDWKELRKSRSDAFSDRAPAAPMKAEMRLAQEVAPAQDQERSVDEVKPLVPVTIAETSLAVSPFTPRWAGGQLFLLRTVSNSSQKYIQGIWLDWESVRKVLLSSIADFLPDADLVPLTSGEVTRDNVTRVLAGLPVLIEPGRLPDHAVSGMSSMRRALVVVCGFALAAAVVAVFLFRGLVKLSERRATFVSAVTHELRTPLTTFNLYTEMLTEGLVPQKKMTSYFATLRQEALRLTHLVDNVLSFSRLEKSRPGRHPECISLEGLKEAVLKHISPRLEGAGMTVEALLDDREAEREVCTDVTAVEQIMYNLAENAAKYAAGEGAAVIWEIRPRGKSLVLRFRDNGPGIPESLRKKLFRPFSRSAEEAAGKKPGVGLGLALSREIARDLGGELDWEQQEGRGACFVLTLPWKTGKSREWSSLS